MKKKLFAGFLTFFLAAGVSFFGFQFITKTGFFRIPGELIFDESVSESTADSLRQKFSESDTELKKNLSLSTVDSLTPLSAEEGENELYLLTDIFVPTADFYSLETSVDATTFQSLFSSRDPSIISVRSLDSSQKLLSVDNAYYLDSFSSGAMFEYLKLEGENQEDLSLASSLLSPDLPAFPSKDSVLSFAQTGVTALSRGMNSKMNAVNSGAYFAENLAGFLSGFDLTHTSNESSFSNSASSANICSDWRFVDTFTAIGLNIVELTGNHNQDCGDTAATETYEKYLELGIQPVGGGRTADEAATPLTLNQKGTGLTFLAYNQSTGGATYDATPGANQYYEDDARSRISEAKARGDFVIVDVQYYECSSYDYTYEATACDYADSSAGDQIGLFRSLIDMGADVVVGTSAHQAQTFERYNTGAIYYGLGNLFFDQIWWPGTTRSLGLVHYFYQGKLLQTRRFGTVYDSSYQTRLMNSEEENYFFSRLNAARPGA